MHTRLWWGVVEEEYRRGCSDNTEMKASCAGDITLGKETGVTLVNLWVS
jgi:hypothetical protein